MHPKLLKYLAKLLSDVKIELSLLPQTISLTPNVASTQSTTFPIYLSV